MKENFNGGTEPTKLALVNAPINKNYQDSTSIFYPPLGLLSIKSYLEINMDNIDVLLLDGMILSLTEIIADCRQSGVGVSTPTPLFSVFGWFPEIFEKNEIYRFLAALFFVSF